MSLPQSAVDSVLSKSEAIPGDAREVRGFEFSTGAELDGLLAAYRTSGFQATNLGLAIETVNEMLNWSSEGALDTEPTRECAIWLSFTSNMISSGLRETFVYLAKHKMVDVIVTSAGGVEEDIIKSLAPTYIGDFSMKGNELRERGWNRIGNLVVPNDNYCKFEDWVQPVLDQMLIEQTAGAEWTPSQIVDRLGKEINSEDSLCYWCHRNSIPIFSPALTDGSLGDICFFIRTGIRGLSAT